MGKKKRRGDPCGRAGKEDGQNACSPPGCTPHSRSGTLPLLAPALLNGSLGPFRTPNPNSHVILVLSASEAHPRPLPTGTAQLIPQPLTGIYPICLYLTSFGKGHRRPAYRQQLSSRMAQTNSQMNLEISYKESASPVRPRKLRTS